MDQEKQKRLEEIKELMQRRDDVCDMYRKLPEPIEYVQPVMISVSVCELVLQEILICSGVTVHERLVYADDGQRKRVIPVISYCSMLKDEKIIPGSVSLLLKAIRNFRNTAAHGNKLTAKDFQEFEKAYDAFICWAFEECDIIWNSEGDTRKWFYDYIIKTENNLSMQIELKQFSNAVGNRQDERQRERLYVYNEMLGKQDKEREELKKQETLDLYRQMMLEIVGESSANIIDALTQKIDSSTELISEKLDNMTEILEGLISQINAYQVLVEKQIDMALTEDEIDRIIQAYMNTCVERIVGEIDCKYSSKTYEDERRKLIDSLGESAWGKLAGESREFLISAKVSYNYLVGIKNAIDYSGVCLLVTKALEVEMKKRFYTDYIAYLKKTYPGKSNISKYPAALLNKDGYIIRDKDFTLGRVPFVLCSKHGKYDSEEQKKNSRDRLAEYSKSSLFKKKQADEIIDILTEYGEEIEQITNEYRNKAAHTNKVKRVDAKMCFDLVLDVEKLLKRMLDSFAY